MRQRGALFCLTGCHEYLIFLLPYGRGFRLTCEGIMPQIFLPCRCVFLPPRREQHILLFLPYGSDVSPSGEVGTPARRAARWGRLWGYAPFAAPLASPPKHPQRAFSIPAIRRGHASYAAGASLTRSARSGDLPPRRVNAIARCRVGQTPFQPNTMGSFTRFVPRFAPFPHATPLLGIQKYYA